MSKGNDLRGGVGAGIATYAQLLSSVKANGRSFIRNNKIDSYVQGIYPRDHGLSIMEDNWFGDVGTAVVNDSSVTHLVSNNNRCQDGTLI